jgi:hypothetical protein
MCSRLAHKAHTRPHGVFSLCVRACVCMRACVSLVVCVRVCVCVCEAKMQLLQDSQKQVQSTTATMRALGLEDGAEGLDDTAAKFAKLKQEQKESEEAARAALEEEYERMAREAEALNEMNDELVNREGIRQQHEIVQSQLINQTKQQQKTKQGGAVRVPGKDEGCVVS